MMFVQINGPKVYPAVLEIITQYPEYVTLYSLPPEPETYLKQGYLIHPIISTLIA